MGEGLQVRFDSDYLCILSLLSILRRIALSLDFLRKICRLHSHRKAIHNGIITNTSAQGAMMNDGVLITVRIA